MASRYSRIQIRVLYGTCNKHFSGITLELNSTYSKYFNILQCHEAPTRVVDQYFNLCDSCVRFL